MLRTRDQGRRLRELIQNNPKLMAIEAVPMLRLALMDKRFKRRYHETVTTASLYDAINPSEWDNVGEAEKAAVTELFTMPAINVSGHGRAMLVLMAAFPETSATWKNVFEIISEPISMLEEANLPEPTLHEIEIARTIPWPIRH